LGLPIYDFKLGTLSDQEFIENWRGLSTPCIVLFEDIDNVFDKRESLTDHRSLSFDTVLNTISGVNLVNGVFLIVTTNHLEKIDPALGVNDANTPKMSTRPGRVDVVIRLGNLDEAGRYQVARRILQDWPITIAGLVNENTNVTPAQFQELCVEAAFQQMQADRDRREREIVLGAIGGSQTVGQQTRTEGATYSL
jgi:SpoVK/Ycf46/Vps4 family AAA+-type ATPase